MARQGRQAIRFKLVGFKRSDPLPTALRKMYNLDKRRALLLKVMKAAAEPMRAAMEQGSPVDKGTLKRSFRIRNSKKKTSFKQLAIYVGGVNGNYVSGGEKKRLAGWRSHWAELGTVHHPGAYFIQPAIRRNIPVYQRLLREGLRNLLRNVRRGTA